MMHKTKRSHRIIALFLTLNFLSTIIPYNYVIASNNGPTAPEAVSFEPLDVTDMVNLATGDMTYVLPLLNVPSPEGGFPLSIAYHAGIGMAQEASWVGLGWSLNPGAINRSVNGMPDDWLDGRYKEYFYDKGTTLTDYSIGYGLPLDPTGMSSLSVNLSWGDSRGFGGSVGYSSIDGNRISVGTDGLNFSTAGGLVSGGIGKNGINVGVGGRIGNAVGVDLGLKVGLDPSLNGYAKTNADVNMQSAFPVGENSAMGMKLSSDGVQVSASMKNNGKTTYSAGGYIASSSVEMNDYNIATSGFHIPIPTPWGIFSFGKTKTKISLDKTKDNVVNGSLYFKDNRNLFDATSNYEYLLFFREDSLDGDIKTFKTPEIDHASDIYEVNIQSTAALELQRNNAAFPNFDSYRVTSQGIAGSLMPRYQKPGALIGTDKEVDRKYQKFKNTYELPNVGSSFADNTDFEGMPYFHFENEYVENQFASKLQLNGDIPNTTSIFDYMDGVVATEARKKSARYVEYWTNEQLASGLGFSTGLLRDKISTDYGDIQDFEQDGIGAFKITAADGKTYHYSIPVYNHEVIARTFGMSSDNPDEEDAFTEKRQVKKYATHWLLTAITGADFVDFNGNQMPDEEDYGYWVKFDYGKWSNGYIWYNPHGKEYELDGWDDSIKNYSWGRKDVYYLDQVITRTHTALMVKEERLDALGKGLTYNARRDKYTSKNIGFPSQSQLKLVEILLVKNEFLPQMTKENSASLQTSPSPNHEKQIEWYETVADGGGTKTLSYSQQDKVIDVNDNVDWSFIRSKALKSIQMGYDYSLATNAPYSSANGRLALRSIYSKGKGGVQLIPPYRFSYVNGVYDVERTDEWGYDFDTPWQWSLNEIVTPTGGKIEVEYEADSFYPVLGENFSFSTTGSVDSNNRIDIHFEVPYENFGINVGSVVNVSYRLVTSCSENQNTTEATPYTLDKYDGTATAVSSADNETLTFQLDGTPEEVEWISYGSDCAAIIKGNTYTRITPQTRLFTSGLRVKALSMSNDKEVYRTTYDYSRPGTNISSGVVAYVPFAPYSNKEVPYAAELPPPIPMYEYVKTEEVGLDNTSTGYNQYQFMVFPKLDQELSFGNVLKFQKSSQNFDNNNVGAEVEIADLEIFDNTAALGQLVSISRFNSLGQLQSKTINEYSTFEDVPQGIASESYQYYKILDYTSDAISDRWNLNTSTKYKYGNTLKSTTVIANGFSTTTYFDKHDLYTGQLLESTTERSDGKAIKSITRPAYHFYPNMGSKNEHIFNKNMLTQTALSKSELWLNNKWNVLNASINTWKDWGDDLPSGLDYPIWRKHQTFVWDGSLDEDGFFENYGGLDDNFIWNAAVSVEQPEQWKKLSEITQYNTYSKPLELRDINNNAASTKYGYKDSKIIAIGNCSYNEMFYSGAEDFDGIGFGGDVALENGVIITDAHTGNAAIQLNNGGTTFSVTPSYEGGTKNFKSSLWVKKGGEQNVKLKIGTQQVEPNEAEMVYAGEWVQLNYSSDISSGTNVSIISNGGLAIVDDFRLHPIMSSMSTYVYNEWDELSFIIGANNMASKFEYDAAGRLKESYTEVEDFNGANSGGFISTSRHKYNYKLAQN